MGHEWKEATAAVKEADAKVVEKISWDVKDHCWEVVGAENEDDRAQNC